MVSRNVTFTTPKALCEETVVSVEDGNVELQTARNDPLINSFNHIQLSRWQGQCGYAILRLQSDDFVLYQVCTKCEPRSQPLKDVYATIVRGLKEDDGALKAVQKLLISTSVERDYSVQETCHLLMLQMYMCQRTEQSQNNHVLSQCLGSVFIIIVAPGLPVFAPV